MKIAPDFKSYKQLASKGNLVALSCHLPADLETPVSTFLKLADANDYAFLLESAEQGESIGRYSIIGLKPKLILQKHGDKVDFLSSKGKRQKSVKSTLVEVLESQMAHYRLANADSIPGFCGGFVGYLSYENVETFEDIKLRKKKSAGVPEGIFFLSEELIVFDHYRKTQSIVMIVDVSRGKSLKSEYDKACRRIKKYIRDLDRPLKIRKSRNQKTSLKVKSNMTPAQFQSKVKKIKEYIRSGDCIQVVLSQRFTLTGARNDFQIYRALRSVNPSPYMFYFKSKNIRLIGSSPEVLVKKVGTRAETRPIAGTRPRGKTASADLAFAESLKRSPKEMAEHLMLVDLGRNDLGRVCQFDSVKVEDFARIENYSHVMHLVSDVAGKLKTGRNAFDLLKAAFPAGTLSGAPKIRAMQIIDELENDKRGPYGGCVGYFGFNRDMDMCITIRTLVMSGKKVYLQAGAGIVKDSNPKREYEETCNKAKALLRAIELQDDFQ